MLINSLFFKFRHSVREGFAPHAYPLKALSGCSAIDKNQDPGIETASFVTTAVEIRKPRSKNKVRDGRNLITDLLHVYTHTKLLQCT